MNHTLIAIKTIGRYSLISYQCWLKKDLYFMPQRVSDIFINTV